MHEICSVVAVMALAFSQQAASPDTAPPASVDRVRSALDQPPSKLTLQIREPDFRVHIEQRRPLQDIFDTPPWQLPPIGWQPPAIGFDLMSLVQYAIKSAATAKRAHDERMARETVQREIAAYCAAQPNGGARIQICSTSPAIR